MEFKEKKILKIKEWNPASQERGRLRDWGSRKTIKHLYRRLERNQSRRQVWGRKIPGEKECNRTEGLRETTLGNKIRNMTAADEKEKQNKTENQKQYEEMFW